MTLCGAIRDLRLGLTDTQLADHMVKKRLVLNSKNNRGGAHKRTLKPVSYLFTHQQHRYSLKRLVALELTRTHAKPFNHRHNRRQLTTTNMSRP